MVSDTSIFKECLFHFPHQTVSLCKTPYVVLPLGTALMCAVEECRVLTKLSRV